MKQTFLFAAASVFLFHASSIFAASTSTCKITDLYEYNTEISAGNWIVKFLESHEFLQKAANKLAPLQLTNIHLPSNKTHILGMDWNFDIMIDSIWLRELKTLHVAPITVMDTTKIQFGGGMGDLMIDRMELTVAVSNFILPQQKMKLAVDTELLQFYMTSTLDLQIMECDGAFKDRILCEIESSWSYFKSLFTRSFSTELLKRIKSAHVDDMSITFNKFNNLNVKLVDAGNVPNALIQYIMDFVKYSSEKSSTLQHVVEGVLSSFSLMEANDEIELIRGSFASAC